MMCGGGQRESKEGQNEGGYRTENQPRGEIARFRRSYKNLGEAYGKQEVETVKNKDLKIGKKRKKENCKHSQKNAPNSWQKVISKKRKRKGQPPRKKKAKGVLIADAKGGCAQSVEPWANKILKKTVAEKPERKRVYQRQDSGTLGGTQTKKKTASPFRRSMGWLNRRNSKTISRVETLVSITRLGRAGNRKTCPSLSAQGPPAGAAQGCSGP